MSGNMPWFRFYTEALDDRKLAHVIRQSEQPKVIIIGLWTTILAIANNSPSRGTLQLTNDIPITLFDLSIETGLDIELVSTLVSLLVEVGVLEILDSDIYSVTNWERYCVPPHRCNTSEWKATRIIILERDNHTCQYCGQRATHVDHIVPVVQGGDDTEENLVAACRSCNLHKSGRTPKQANMKLMGG